MTVVSMNYLLEAGVHFGHQTKRWNPKMKEYIFTSRDDIYIIDLQKTAKKIEEAYAALNAIAANGGKVLFVGTKKQAVEATKEEATRSNSFYVTERWLGGTLTNFKTIRSRVKRIEEIEKMEKDGTFEVLPKKEVIGLKKELGKLDNLLSGIRGMYKLPSAMIIVDPSKEDIAIKEARKLNIPVFGIVDTNCDPDDVDFVIPSNDDAIRAVKLVLGVLNNAIVEANGGELNDYLIEEDKIRKNRKAEVIAKEAAAASTSKDLVTEPVKEEAKIEVKTETKVEVETKVEAKKEEKVEKTKKTKKETVKEEAKEDLSKLTVAVLKERAKAAGIEGYSKLKKDELIKVLQ